MKHVFFAGICSLFFVASLHAQVATTAGSQPSAPDLAAFHPRDDVWLGFTRHNFQIDGCNCWLAEPKSPMAGNHWVWCMMFPTAYPQRTGAIALLGKGFYYAYVSVGDTFGAPPALAHLDAFYDALIKAGLRSKVALMGISRGGLYAYNWAAKNPEEVSVIYGDAPVCNFESWPYAHGNPSGAVEWKKLLAIYGFTTNAQAFACVSQPIHELEPLAKAKIPLISVVGDADTTVPYPENTAIVEKEYKQLGGEITVIHKPGMGHHPHGLDDPTPVVDFITLHDR